MGRESDIALEISTIEDCSRKLSVGGVRAGIGDAGTEGLSEQIGDWYVNVHRNLSDLGHQFGVGSVVAATDLALAAYERGLLQPGEETLEFVRTLSEKVWSAHPHNVRSVDRAAEQRY